jgi:armadillo repeat-containing protein 8
MVQSPVMIALEEIRAPTNPAAQIAALKYIKNDIVGHDQRKASLLRGGLPIYLTRILETKSAHELNRHVNRQNSHSNWSEHDELRLHAILITGSLAQGLFEQLVFLGRD